MKKTIPLLLLLAATAAHAQFDAIRTLRPDQGQEVRRPIEARVFCSTQSELPAIEAELLEIFQAPETTLEGRQYCCRMLRFCASEACVPVLAPKLTDLDLSSFVRLVFQGLETPAADKALAKALPKADPVLKIGIIGTLGQRGSTKSVKAIKPHLKGKDAQIQSAAITALGNIGGKEAAKALVKAKVAPQLSNDWKRAQLKCAATLDAKTAPRAYQKFLATDQDEEIRAEALAGWTHLAPQEAAPTVFEWLSSDSAHLKKIAIGLLPALPTPQLIQAGKKADSKNQALIIRALSDRKDPPVEEFVISTLSNTNAVVQSAAFTALGKVGGAASIDILLAAVPNNDAAFGALCQLDATGISAAIFQALENSGDDRFKEKMIECLALRQKHSALPVIVTYAEDPWSRTTKTAIDALAALVRTEEFGIYARLIMESKEPKKRAALEQSAALACQRQPDANACSLQLIRSSKAAKGEAEYAILRTLGSMGGPTAYELLAQSLSSSDPQIVDASIRGLANWPTLDAADQLLELATAAESETHRVIALRGYIRLAGTESDPEKNLEMCRMAADATDQPAELISIIGCAKHNRNEPVLEFLTQQLDNPEIFTEAAWAICEISRDRKLRQLSVPALERIAAGATDGQLLDEARARIKENQK